ncbi:MULTISPECIES: SIR2 family NAD-dependent protein deacylase [unclassified Nocardioides]|uniref:SIR2 family NAD-dependent protein deacylase n=1 Tax=unclassified Nocardioides TaxID=2615069 RepID=UPI0009E6D692|nr:MULTISPECIES: SIR2 family protein [unclassified Nocardioides]
MTFDLGDVGILILDAVAVLHRRGHERLRILPGMSGSGMYWRTSVSSVENFTEDDGYLQLRDFEQAFFYTTGNEFEVADSVVDRETTAEQLADRILAVIPDDGQGADADYVRWYASLLELVHRDRALPIAYADYFEPEEGWEIGWGSGVRLPGPPQPVPVTAPFASSGAAESPGHVFVVLGRIESVVHDVAIISTSDAFKIRPYWRTLLGGSEVEGHRPERLANDGYGPSPADSRYWFVSVGAEKGSRLEEIHQRLSSAIGEIADLGYRPGANRAKVLVAVPVIGIAGGGLGERRGEVIRRQLEVCAQLAARHRIDIAIVTPSRAVHGAAQYLRSKLRTPAGWDLSEPLQLQAKRIGGLAQSGELALFLGAGVSLPAGLPTWDDLIGRLSGGKLGSKESDLSALDQAQLLELRAEPGELGKRVAKIASEALRPSLGHALLASLGASEVVTTNYDRLFETAVAAAADEHEDAIAILPWGTIKPDRPWILKMHGDIEHPDKIVLTRRHFVQFDAQTRPAGALLQSLLMTRHLLVVGVSLNDDNVVRLAHEVQAYRESHGLGGNLRHPARSQRRSAARRTLEWPTRLGDAARQDRCGECADARDLPRRRCRGSEFQHVLASRRAVRRPARDRQQSQARPTGSRAVRRAPARLEDVGAVAGPASRTRSRVGTVNGVSLAIDAGGPGWLNLVALVLCWDAIKFVLLALLVAVRFVVAVCQRVFGRQANHGAATAHVGPPASVS